VEAPPAKTSRAANPREYRKDAAGHLYEKYADRIYAGKLPPLLQAVGVLEVHLRAFMEKHVRKTDIGLFYEVSNETAPSTIKEVPIHYLIPAFIISELKTAFQIGFLLYIPFLVLDMVVASVLMAMGMMMLPPMLVSLPFKLLLFVLVYGWQLVTGSILRSFNT
jgi:flagellar biosynthetic protein FliP